MASTQGIGIANLPNQRHKIVAKRGGHFTLMVVGESGLGKTTLINTLFSTELASVKDYSKRFAKQMDKTTEIDIIKAELEEKQFKVKLTVIDTPGFGDYVNNRDSWNPIVDFIDDQHESYMRQEQQPQRDSKLDLRVHACLYLPRRAEPEDEETSGYGRKPPPVQVGERTRLLGGGNDAWTAADTVDGISGGKWQYVWGEVVCYAKHMLPPILLFVGVVLVIALFAYKQAIRDRFPPTTEEP